LRAADVRVVFRQPALHTLGAVPPQVSTTHADASCGRGPDAQASLSFDAGSCSSDTTVRYHRVRAEPICDIAVNWTGPILRHAQIDVTMEACTEVSDEKTRRALKRLGKQFDS